MLKWIPLNVAVDYTESGGVWGGFLQDLRLGFPQSGELGVKGGGRHQTDPMWNCVTRVGDYLLGGVQTVLNRCGGGKPVEGTLWWRGRSESLTRKEGGAILLVIGGEGLWVMGLLRCWAVVGGECGVSRGYSKKRLICSDAGEVRQQGDHGGAFCFS